MQKHIYIFSGLLLLIFSGNTLCTSLIATAVMINTVVVAEKIMRSDFIWWDHLKLFGDHIYGVIARGRFLLSFDSPLD